MKSWALRLPFYSLKDFKGIDVSNNFFSTVLRGVKVTKIMKKKIGKKSYYF